MKEVVGLWGEKRDIKANSGIREEKICIYLNMYIFVTVGFCGFFFDNMF